MKVKAQIIAGDINYSDYLLPERIENYKIRSAYIELSPLKPVTLGFNFIHSIGELPEDNVRTTVKTDLPEINMNLNFLSKLFLFFG